MTVFLIVGGTHLEAGHLCSSLGRDTLRGRVLLREDRLELQFTKLHIGSDTKQRGGATYQRVIGREGDTTQLHQFDDLIFFSFILQLQVLRIKIEGSIGIVVEVHIDLITHLTIDAQIDLLIEIEGLGISVTLRQ